MLQNFTTMHEAKTKFVVCHFPPVVSGAQVCNRLRGLR